MLGKILPNNRTVVLGEELRLYGYPLLEVAGASIMRPGKGGDERPLRSFEQRGFSAASTGAGFYFHVAMPADAAPKRLDALNAIARQHDQALRESFRQSGIPVARIENKWLPRFLADHYAGHVFDVVGARAKEGEQVVPPRVLTFSLPTQFVHETNLGDRQAEAEALMLRHTAEFIRDAHHELGLSAYALVREGNARYFVELQKGGGLKVVGKQLKLVENLPEEGAHAKADDGQILIDAGRMVDAGDYKLCVPGGRLFHVVKPMEESEVTADLRKALAKKLGLSTQN
jgi:hypothetical protein